MRSRHRPTAVGCFDLDGDGASELVTGTASGRFEIRDAERGSLYLKESMGGSGGAGVAAITTGDLRRKGRPELILCSSDGQVRGYECAIDEQHVAMVDASKEIARLEAEKGRLQEQLARMRLLQQRQAVPGAEEQATLANLQLLHQRATFTAAWMPAASGDSLEIRLQCPVDVWLRAAALYGEGVFQSPVGESIVHVPSAPTREVILPIQLAKDAPATIEVTCLLASSATGGVVHNVTALLKLPKFTMYAPLWGAAAGADVPLPAGYARLVLRERGERITAWIASAFNTRLPPDLSPSQFNFPLRSIRTGARFAITVAPTDEAGANAVTVHGDQMGVVGDMVQDLCDVLGVKEVQSEGYFPREMEELGVVLDQLSEFNANRLRFQAEAADASNQVKGWVVRTEDARLLHDLEGMERGFNRLQEVNRDLLMEHSKRTTNHENLLGGLKKVNAAIQAASRLRRGQASTDVVVQCREAIRQDNFSALFRIMQKGVPRKE